MNLLSVQFTAPLRNFLQLKPKYLPQYPILKNPQPIFLSHCERPSFTPIQYNRQKNNYLHFNLYILRNVASSCLTSIYLGLFLQQTLMHNSITHVCHITILDMFRALTCPSSGGTTAQTQHLVSSLS